MKEPEIFYVLKDTKEQYYTNLFRTSWSLGEARKYKTPEEAKSDMGKINGTWRMTTNIFSIKKVEITDVQE